MNSDTLRHIGKILFNFTQSNFEEIRKNSQGI